MLTLDTSIPPDSCGCGLYVLFCSCVTWNVADDHFHVTTVVIPVFLECQGIGHGLRPAVPGHAVGVTVRPIPVVGFVFKKATHVPMRCTGILHSTHR
jgi:hypothetical protein